MLLSSIKNVNWTWYLIPMNASCTGLSTIIPLYILQLNGSVKEVAISAFLSNLAMTIGAIFWGKLIDTMNWRKSIIVISSIGVAISSISIFLVYDMTVLMLVSAAIGFFSVGPAPVTNLLVMEKSRKEFWVKTYGWTSLISCIGLVISTVLGYVWLTHFDARTYALICFAVAGSSLALTVLFVKDPASTTARYMIASSHTSLSERVRQIPLMLLKVESGFKFKKIEKSFSKKESLFFAGVGLFFLSSNMIFTPYTPFLKENGVTDSQVFLAYTVLHLTKVLYLPFNHKIVNKRGEQKMALIAYIPRMSGIMLMVIAAIFTQGSAVLFISIAAFIAVDSGFSLWNTTTTASLLNIIPRGKEGSVLGTNSSIVGAGLLIGSVFAGEMATVFGYDITFTIGMAFLFASFAMMKKFYKRVQVPILVPELRQLKTKTRY